MFVSKKRQAVKNFIFGRNEGKGCTLLGEEEKIDETRRHLFSVVIFSQFTDIVRVLSIFQQMCTYLDFYWIFDVFLADFYLIFVFLAVLAGHGK